MQVKKPYRKPSHPNRKMKHGYAKRGPHHARRPIPEYDAWLRMIRRCTNPKDSQYERYGGRGIRVCDRWMSSVAAFIEDMGKRPDGMTLDRINNDGDYEPGNCRWATVTEQANNRRTNVFLEHDGKRMTINQWVRETGISQRTIRHRLAKGMSASDALTTPLDQRRRPKHARDLLRDELDKTAEVTSRLGATLAALDARRGGG